MTGEPRGRSARLTSVRRAGWSLLAVLLGLIASAGPARAQEGGGQVAVAVTVGLDGRVGLARSYPVVVDVTSPMLLSGTLRITATTDGGRDVIQRPIEVAGGTTKRFALTVGSSNGFGGDRLRVDVLADGDTVASETPPMASDGTEELVGVLPGIAGTLDRDTTPLAVDLGQARLGPVPPEVLAEGPVAIEVYDQIAAGPGDLDDLSDTDLATIVRWVGNGGTLLLDGDAAVAALPEGFDPAPGTARVVGLGRVLLTDGAMAAGRWQDVLVPTPVQAQAEEDILSNGLSLSGDVAASLAVDAGFDVPSIRTLLLVLAAYIVVVGPIAWLAVRRRRTTLLWGIIPAVALLTTGLVQVAGNEFRSSDEAVHVTMIETAPGGAMATTSVFVAGQTGTTSIDLPHGWRTAVNPYFSGFGFLQDEPPPLSRLGDVSQVSVDPGVGGASVVRARGPVELDGGLVLTATSDADGLMRGTVENTLDVDLVDVAVMISRATVLEVGDLAAGETAEWETDRATHFEFGMEPESQVWPYDVAQEFGFEGGDGVIFDPSTGAPREAAASVEGSSIASSLSAYGDVLSERGSNFKPAGQAVAVGWTRALDAPFRVGGATVDKGRTGVVTRTAATSVGGRLVDTGSVRFLLRGPEGAGTMAAAEGAPPLGGGTMGVWGFNLPSAVGERPVDVDRLELHLPALFPRVQVWADGRWRDVPAGEGEVALPDGAVTGQMVFVRAVVNVDQIPGPGREFVLYEAGT
jgi:hypothetical protein